VKVGEGSDSASVGNLGERCHPGMLAGAIKKRGTAGHRRLLSRQTRPPVADPEA